MPKKHTRRLEELLGEATAEDLSSVIESNTTPPRPVFGGPRISSCDIVVDVCEPEDPLLWWRRSRRSVAEEYEVPLVTESRSE